MISFPGLSIIHDNTNTKTHISILDKFNQNLYVHIQNKTEVPGVGVGGCGGVGEGIDNDYISADAVWLPSGFSSKRMQSALQDFTPLLLKQQLDYQYFLPTVNCFHTRKLHWPEL